MSVAEFLENYVGNACVSIEGDCEEADFDAFDGLTEESWWYEVKDLEVKKWNIIGGGMYKNELWIQL